MQEDLLVRQMRSPAMMYSQVLDQSDRYSTLIDQLLMYLFLGPRLSYLRLVTMPIPGLLFERQYLGPFDSFVPLLHLEQ